MMSAAGLRRGRFPPRTVRRGWVDRLLSAIGLDEGQESAYRALVALGAAEVPDLAHRLALPVPQTERALRHLERHGLAAQSSTRPGRWVAAPPGWRWGRC